ncbi:hypothetical protein SC206_05820 [Rouxiella sp. T17]|uniref:hypothetical protein n=1 Tax=Rouxiella sp. T17 TaxID=3085684 RepID=UPI002FC6EB12
MIHNTLSTDKQCKRAIYHELGHWLMGRNVGFDVGKIIIGTSHVGVYGNSAINPSPKTKLDSTNAIYEHLFNRVCILNAGVIADILWHKKYELEIDSKNDTSFFYNNGVMDKTAITDKGKIEELLPIMNGIVNTPAQDEKLLKKQMDAIQGKAWDSSLSFLQNNKDLEFMGSELIKEFGEFGKQHFTTEYLIKLQENSRASESL